MPAALRSRPELAAALIAALAAVAFGQLYLNYDSFYALVWGRDLLDGRSPDYDVTLTPTPHPLLTLAGSGAALFGDGAAPVVMSVLVAASWVALVAATFLLGARLFGRPAGAIAALALATREPLASWAVRGYVDMPFLALVVSAAAIEAGRRRAGWPVLALLGVAGLLRPEAWALAGLYWLWLLPELGRRARIATACLVAAAPLGWAAFDLITAGDALHSFTGTRDNVDTLGRPTGLDDVPYRFARLLGYLTQEPGVIGAAGAVACFLWLRRRSALPLAGLGAGLAIFTAYGVAGLPLISRYLTVPAVALLVLCGAALVAWRELPDGELRRRWRIGAAIGAVALVATLPLQVNRLSDLHSSSQVRSGIQDDLRDLTEEPRARRVLDRCERIYLPNHRPVPILSWWLDRPPADLRSAAVERPRVGAFVSPASEAVRRNFTLDRRDPKRLDARVPERFRRVAGNRSWVLYEEPGRC